MVKQNMKPFEELFFEVGAEIMTNVSGWLAANPDSTVQRVKKQLDAEYKVASDIASIAEMADPNDGKC